MNEVKDRILRVADVKEHARRAGFRDATRGNRWYCAIHQDKNPSCTVKDGKIHCWTCDKIWDAVELEMLSTGGSYWRTVKALAKEYGVQIHELTPAQRATARAEWNKYAKESERWKYGAILKYKAMLAYAKGNLFLDNGTINTKAEAITLAATGKLNMLKGMGKHETLAEYKHELESNKREADRLVRVGEDHLRECESYCKKMVKVLELAHG